MSCRRSGFFLSFLIENFRAIDILNHFETMKGIDFSKVMNGPDPALRTDWKHLNTNENSDWYVQMVLYIFYYLLIFIYRKRCKCAIVMQFEWLMSIQQFRMDIPFLWARGTWARLPARCACASRPSCPTTADLRSIMFGTTLSAIRVSPGSSSSTCCS